MNLRRHIGFAVVVGVVGCSSPSGDPPAAAVPPAAFGSALHIRDVMNPASPHHPASGAVVGISGVSYLLTDSYDETADGKSRGTVYVQDAESSAPYSGASLFQPTYIPANLKPAPGDVLDLPTGTYSAVANIGSFAFNPGTKLVQISKPDVTFRFDAVRQTVPAVINVTDLNDYATGLKWLSMVVTINNVSLTSSLAVAAGRATATIQTGSASATVTVSNELFDLSAWNAQSNALKAGATIKSITGIVTWFNAYHIAPRTPADIVVQ